MKKRRLILCGICFLEGCPLSRWVDDTDDDTDDRGLEVLDELTEMFFDEIHSEIEVEQAAKRTEAEKVVLIQKEETRLSDLLNIQVQVEREHTPITMAKDISPMDML